jgi:hypothetical protein
MGESKCLIFVNKKKQKNFDPVGAGTAGDQARKDQKFFGCFFQKRTSSLFVA